MPSGQEVRVWEKERKAVRVPAAEPVSGSFTNGGAHAISGITRDLSTGGTFFYCELAPEVGALQDLLGGILGRAGGSPARRSS